MTQRMLLKLLGVLVSMLLTPMLAYAAPFELQAPDLSSYYASEGRSTPLYETQGYYIRGQGSIGSGDLKRLKGSGTIDVLAGADPVPTPPNARERDSVFGGNLAIGYAVKNLSSFAPNRAEIEYSVRAAEYSINPPFTGTPEIDLNAQLLSHTIMINIYNDLISSNRVSLYYGGGAGVVLNSEKSKLSNSLEARSTQLTNSTTSTAWNLRAGIRIQVQKGLDFDISIEHVSYGTAQWKVRENNATRVTDAKVRTSNMTADVINIGFLWQVFE